MWCGKPDGSRDSDLGKAPSRFGENGDAIDISSRRPVAAEIGGALDGFSDVASLCTSKVP